MHNNGPKPDLHLIDGTEPGKDGVLALCQRALELRAGSAPKQTGGVVAAVFCNPSLRTRASLQAACAALGAHPIVMEPGKGSWALELEDGAVMNGTSVEHVSDAVGVLSSYADVLAVRAFASLEDREEDSADPVITAFVKHSPVPVVNLESARFHPMQGLADSATWLSHFGNPAGRKITLTWAPHPKALPAAVANQVLTSAALLDMDVTVAHPEGFDLDPAILAATGATVTHDQHAALADADVVVAKSWGGWSGYGRRDEEAAVRATLGHWQVADLPASTGFMHCLPVRRNVVVSDAVIDGPGSWVQETAALRMWTKMALLETLL